MTNIFSKIIFIAIFASIPLLSYSQDQKLTDDPTKEWCYLQKSTTVIGMPFHPGVTEITYDGALYTGYAELCFMYGEDRTPVMARQKNFKEGWIPVVEDVWRDGDIQYSLEMFSAPLKPNDVSNCVNFVKMTMLNTGKTIAKGTFTAASRGKLPDYRLAELTDFSSENTYEIKENASYRDNKLIYTFDKGSKTIEAINGNAYKSPFTGKSLDVTPETLTTIVSYERELKKGEKAEFVFKMPRVPISDSNIIAEIEKADYSEYLAKTLSFWKQLIGSTTSFDIPESRINDAQKASMVHLILATRTFPDGHKTQTDGIPYPNFFLTSAPQMVMAYLTSGCYDLAKLSVINAIAQQEQDGLYFDRSLAHGGILPTAHGHILFMTSNYYLFTRDKKTGEQIFPSIVKAIEYLKRETSNNQYGLLPPTYPYDNEMIDGHYASNNYWALTGLRFCIRMAEDLGHTEVLDEWKNLEKEYTTSILKGIEASVWEDGYVPPGLYPYLTGKKARRGFEEYQTHCDWENMLLSYPTEILNPDHKYVSSSLNHIRKGYAEGIMTYRHGMHLHQYITANLIEQYMVQGNQQQALIDFYHLILHSGSTHEGFENLVIPWKDRQVDAQCPPPHAWASAKTAFLIRNFLIHEYGGRVGMESGRNLYLYSVVSPEWAKEGNHISINSAPTEMGVVSSSIKFLKGEAKISYSAEYTEKPEAVVIKIPYFKTLKSFSSDAKSTKSEEGCIILSPDFTYLNIKWEDNDEVHRGTSEDMLKAYRECNSYEGYDDKGMHILKEGKSFLLDSEKKNLIEPLNFELVKKTFEYEFNRRTNTH